MTGRRTAYDRRKRRLYYSGWVIFLFCFLGVAAWQQSVADALWKTIALRELVGKECSGGEIHRLVSEMACFPVDAAADGPESPEGQRDYVYEDGYGQGRSFGGDRKHEGIDIMSQSGKRGELDIVSVSDGVVEKLGWLPLGGYRVGIRGESGFYYYYAHMDSYAPGLSQGDTVRAGQVLGKMGDTGYGEEGTRGKFPVHLHFGIYRQKGGEEKSLNPYYFLRYLEGMAV